MPRGRRWKSPEEAKTDSLRAILKSLQEKTVGKRFGELKNETGFHQSTLSARLKELISKELVWYDPIKRVYRISESGLVDLETRELIEIIERSSRLILGSIGGASAYPDDDLIIKTSVAYSYPAIKTSSLSYLKRIVHKYFVLHLIHGLARNRLVDARLLTGQRPLSGLVNQLRKNLEDKKQVLAFTIDLGKISKLINMDYLHELVRIAGVEDEHGIQSPHDTSIRYNGLWRKYALEAEALEFIMIHGKASLSQLSEYLNIDAGEAESILDGYARSQDPSPGELMVYDDNGNLIRSIKLGSEEEEVKIIEGAVIKLRIDKSMPLLVKFYDKEGVYYERSDRRQTKNNI